MKKPNDIKRPNPSTPSLGRLYRARERLIHITQRYDRVEKKDDNGVVTISYVPAFPVPRQYTPIKDLIRAYQERAAAFLEQHVDGNIPEKGM